MQAGRVNHYRNADGHADEGVDLTWRLFRNAPTRKTPGIGPLMSDATESHHKG
ncbi:MAG: hypothetical protein IPM25_20240 [Chloracidobacterium sp.]|nr:hypothetical protein [Chloracidobacterium sp.]